MLSEGGIAGALSHRAFLDLDFLAAGCKREGESDLAGEVAVCSEAVATFGDVGLAKILVREGRFAGGSVVLSFALKKADLPFEGRNIALGTLVLLFQILYLLLHIAFGDMKGLVLGDDGPRMLCQSCRFILLLVSLSFQLGNFIFQSEFRFSGSFELCIKT